MKLYSNVLHHTAVLGDTVLFHFICFMYRIRIQLSVTLGHFSLQILVKVRTFISSPVAVLDLIT